MSPFAFLLPREESFLHESLTRAEGLTQDDPHSAWCG